MTAHLTPPYFADVPRRGSLAFALFLFAAAACDSEPPPPAPAAGEDAGISAAPADAAITANEDATITTNPDATTTTNEDATTTPIEDAAIDAGQPANDDAGTITPRSPAIGPLVRLSASAGDLAQFQLDELTAEADGTLILGTGHAANDPFGPGGYHGGNYYNGGSYRYGVAVSPVLEWAYNFDEVVPSFEVDTPEGTWVTIKVRVRMNNRWSKDYVLGIWAYDGSTVSRHSVDDQGDADGDVYTDTLSLNSNADAIQLIAVLLSDRPGVTPRLRALAAAAIDTTSNPRPDLGDPSAYGISLPVPGRSQMIYPDGGEVWCSPTSTSMLLAYWADVLMEPALSRTVPQTALYTYDWIYDGNGNWPFNTAHASAVADGRLHGFVTRFDSFAQLERLIAAGIPVAISISYGNGELGNSPIRSTAGHLIVIKGFAANGDVIANDPAFDADATVGVTYDRTELDTAWSHSERTVYVLYPNDRTLPIDPLGAY